MVNSLAIDQRRRRGHNAVAICFNNAVILPALLRPKNHRHSQSLRVHSLLLSVVLTFKQRFDASGKIRQPFSCARMRAHAPGLLRRGRNAPADWVSASSASCVSAQRRIAGRDLKSFNSVDKPQHFSSRAGDTRGAASRH